MKPHVFVTALACCATFAANTVLAQGQTYVGEVIIVGNTITQDRVIRQAVNLYPGQVLRYPDLALAEAGHLRNEQLGVRPTVTVIESNGPFKDILIKVQETRTGMVRFGGGIHAEAGLLVQFVIDERNFDPFRWPTSKADFKDGRAFRGAGQQVKQPPRLNKTQCNQVVDRLGETATAKRCRRVRTRFDDPGG